MIRKIVEFRVERAHLATCVQAIETFIAAVADNEPGTLEYSSIQKEDEVSFVHFVRFEDETAEELHRGTPHARAFIEMLHPLCAVQPTVQSYRVLAKATR